MFAQVSNIINIATQTETLTRTLNTFMLSWPRATGSGGRRPAGDRRYKLLVVFLTAKLHTKILRILSLSQKDQTLDLKMNSVDCLVFSRF